MSRKGYKCIVVPQKGLARLEVDKTTKEFAETMGYGQILYANPKAFLQHFSDAWILELHNVLKDLLVKDHKTLGIGSGECEHEVRLFLDGYNVIGSDVVADSFTPTVSLFPGFRAIEFDVFASRFSEVFDDLLVTGLDLYYDNDKAQQIFLSSRFLLRSGGRLVFALRYHDNWATWLIDYLGIPALCALWHIRSYLRGQKVDHRLKFHGYRRRRREIITMAEQAGFKLGRVCYAGFGVELSRVGLTLTRLKLLYTILSKFDRHFHWFNNVTIFEFIA